MYNYKTLEKTSMETLHEGFVKFNDDIEDIQVFVEENTKN